MACLSSLACAGWIEGWKRIVALADSALVPKSLTAGCLPSRRCRYHSPGCGTVAANRCSGACCGPCHLLETWPVQTLEQGDQSLLGSLCHLIA